MNGQGHEQMLPPGSLCLPEHPSILGAMVGSGAVVCAFDLRRKRGGMVHYCRPYREKNVLSTARYAGPAIVGLVRMLEKEGTRTEDLSVHLFGGASNEAVPSYEKGLAQENIKVGLEILDKLGVGKVGVDTGGREARRVRFDTGSGQLSLGTTSDLGAAGWYPCPAHVK